MGLIRTFKLGLWGAKTTLKAAWNVVAHPIDSFNTVTSLRLMLKNFEKIPGVEEQTPDAAFLNKTLAIFQMGRVAFCLMHDEDERTDADIFHIDPLTEKYANGTVGAAHFSVSIISRSDKEAEPDISLIINTENFSKNPDKISSDILVEALTMVIKRAPVVGGGLASIAAWPIRKIADFLFGTIIEQAKKVPGMLPGGKTEPPKAHAPETPPALQ